MKYRIIVFRDGKRLERIITQSQLEEAKTKVRALRAEGHKAAIARCLINPDTPRTYPPPESVSGMRAQGYLWCPYCRAWRYFRIPRGHDDVEISSPEWFTNSLRNQEIKICSWCHITERDFWVAKVNGTWEESKAKRHRKRKVRQRVSRS